MSVNISAETEARLLAAARAEGISVNALLESLINEREEFTALADRANAQTGWVSREQVREKIERGFLQSEQGDIADGDSFTNELLTELDEMERKRNG